MVPLHSTSIGSEPSGRTRSRPGAQKCAPGTSAAVSQSYVPINAGAWGSSTGPVNQSSLSVNGNALGAAAYGNSVTNTMTIGGNNVNVTGRLDF